MQRPWIAGVVAGLIAWAGAAGAQNWPTQPVTMVVPFAAGGPTDVVGRVIAARLGEILGQQVVVENVTGAGGMTGAGGARPWRPAHCHDLPCAEWETNRVALR